VLGKGGTLLGLAVAAVLTAGGVATAVAVQLDARQAPPKPQSRVVTIWDAPPVTLDPEPTTTTTTTPPSSQPAQAGGSGSVTITVTITRPPGR
jgi:hypothetical protein